MKGENRNIKRIVLIQIRLSFYFQIFYSKGIKRVKIVIFINCNFCIINCKIIILRALKTLNLKMSNVNICHCRQRTSRRIGFSLRKRLMRTPAGSRSRCPEQVRQSRPHSEPPNWPTTLHRWDLCLPFLDYLTKGLKPLHIWFILFYSLLLHSMFF